MMSSVSIEEGYKPVRQGTTQLVSNSYMCCESAEQLWVYEDEIATYKDHLQDLCEGRKTDIFANAGSKITWDSGFSDVGKLLYPAKYLFALMAVASCIGNFVCIIKEDVPLVYIKDSGGKFLITKFLGTCIFGERFELINVHRLVPLCELLVLGGIIVSILRRLLLALCRPCCEADQMYASYLRWFHISAVLLIWYPYLTSFSIMKLLYYVTPAVITVEAYNLSYTVSNLWLQGDRCRAVGKTIIYIFSRLFCLVVGVDAFLVKFRIAERYVDAAEMSPSGLAYCIFFIFQVLSIVNLRIYTIQRLFLFIFAGEDGLLSIKEEIMQRVWLALLTRQIFMTCGFFKGCVALLAFDDYDYQLLVLAPKSGKTIFFEDKFAQYRASLENSFPEPRQNSIEKTS